MIGQAAGGSTGTAARGSTKTAPPPWLGGSAGLSAAVLSRLTVGFLAAESHVEVLPRDRLDEPFHAIRRPLFLLDRLLEAGDVVRVAGLLGEDDQRAVGGDLMILVGVAGVGVLQRLILRERMHG